MAKKKQRPRQTLFPFLRYENAFDAIEWLARAFGFETEMVVPGEDGAVAHAQLRYGASLVMLGSVADDDPLGLRSPSHPGPEGAFGVSQGIYVVVDEIEEHYEHAQQAGAEILVELTRTEYGSVDYTARDPEGYVWSFGTYHPDDDESED